MRVATGLATHPSASEELAHQAVSLAMQKAGFAIASSVLLFLTPEFARDPQPALRAAARAASCTQIVGCSAAGILTEEDWVLDAPAAAAMVFGHGVRLEALHEAPSDELLLTLAAPNAIHTEWLDKPGRRFGGVSGDASGQGPFSVWQGGKVAQLGRCEVAMRGAAGVAGVSQGVRPLSQQPFAVTQSDGFDVQTLGGKPRSMSWRGNCRWNCAHTIPFRSTSSWQALLTATPPRRLPQAVTVWRRLFRLIRRMARLPCRSVRHPGSNCSGPCASPWPPSVTCVSRWNACNRNWAQPPISACVSPAWGAGLTFTAGWTGDLQLVQQRFPGMPLIGFYGNGEIAPFNGSNQLFQYAAVLGLFSIADASSHV